MIENNVNIYKSINAKNKEIKKDKLSSFYKK